jgi:DNA damage-binding protein 1
LHYNLSLTTLQIALYQLVPARERGGKYTHELDRLASYRTSTNPLSLSVQPSTATTPTSIAVADLMKSLSILHIIPPAESKSNEWELKEVARHFASIWSSATAAIGENDWVLADMDGSCLDEIQKPSQMMIEDASS